MRAGIFQCTGGGWTPEERLGALGDALARHKLDLMVCPELFMSGYNVGDALTALAEPADGPFAGKIGELARTFGTAIVYGYPERADGTLYNSAACVGPAGLIAHHRKLLLPPGFESAHFACGESLTLFDLGGVRCAMLICYDAEYPEAVRAVAEAGAQIVIVPTALTDNWKSVAVQMMPTRAFENGVWLLYANHGGTEAGMRYAGASCIVAPDGVDAARAGPGEEVIYADLDPDRVAAAQARLPYLENVGRMRRIIEKTGK